MQNHCFRDFKRCLTSRADAIADIRGSEKYPNIMGTVLFFKHNGGVIVKTELFGLPKSEDICTTEFFGFHIHSGTECSGNSEDLFANAKQHYNPNNCTHPNHSGDMPPLLGAGGKVYSVFLTNNFTIDEIIGKTIIVHHSGDDFTSQPSGNAGEKIACGIIKPFGYRRYGL